jgi:hypothetical protein
MPTKTKKPNPIDLGEECADFLHKKRNKHNDYLVRAMGMSSQALDIVELDWELNFWRCKALGVEPEV